MSITARQLRIEDTRDTIGQLERQIGVFVEYYRRFVEFRLAAQQARAVDLLFLKLRDQLNEMEREVL